MALEGAAKAADGQDGVMSVCNGADVGGAGEPRGES